jgi:hypothetical protein
VSSRRPRPETTEQRLAFRSTSPEFADTVST